MIAYTATVDFLGVLVLLLAFVIIAENYTHSLVRHLQWQSLILSLLISIIGYFAGMWELIALGILTLVFRGLILPEILLKDIKKEGVWEHREFGAKAKSTLTAGIISSLIAILFYPVIYRDTGTWDAMIPFVLLILGVITMISRKNAIAQISGYVVEENALLYLGVVLFPMGFLLEVGVVLDIIGAVFLAVLLGAEKEYGPMEVEELSG